MLWKYNTIVIAIPGFQYAEIGLNGSFLLSTYVYLYPSAWVDVQESTTAIMELCLYSPCFFNISYSKSAFHEIQAFQGNKCTDYLCADTW